MAKKKCQICGEDLTDENTVGSSPVCVDCQCKYFDRIEEENGTHLAVFICCAAFDIPCFPDVCPIDLSNEEGNRWAGYLEALYDSGKFFSGDKPKDFFAGVCDIRKIFGRELTEKDFAKYVAAEQAKIEKLVGTSTQRTRWGTENLCKDYPMTQDLYDELDKQYDLWMERYKGVDSPQLEQNIITICKRNALSDYLLRTGDYAAAKTVQKMVDDLMSSEQMRKKDEKPVESMRLDALVDALERNGLMESGDLLTYDELIEVLRDKTIKSHKYDYSLDVADQIIADFYNTMRANADKEMVTEFPAELKSEDAYGEFNAEQTETERKNMRFAGLTPVQFTEKQEDE